MSERGALHPLGTSPQPAGSRARTGSTWRRRAPPPRPLTLAARRSTVTLDLARTALMVIDMQNDFCAAGGWVDHLGVDYTPDRAPIAPLQRLLPALRAPRAARSSGSTGATGPTSPTCRRTSIHLYKPSGRGIGLGEPLPGHGARVLEKDSWAAAVVDELAPDAGRHPRRQVPHQRLLGHAARQHPAQPRHRTILFAGVNTDQCVLCTLQDANFLGYGCVLVEDCCATTSPGYCTEATLFNVRKCFGFVTDSQEVLRRLAETA